MRENLLLLPLECDYAAKFFLRMAKNILRNDRYHLHIRLAGIEPPIWRRIVVPGHISLYRLHRMLQVVMGWENAHLHQFIMASGKDSFLEQPYELLELLVHETMVFFDFANEDAYQIHLGVGAPAFHSCNDASEMTAKGMTQNQDDPAPRYAEIRT